METQGISEARRLEASADDIERQARELANDSIKMKARYGIPLSISEISRQQFDAEQTAKKLREQAKALREAERAAPTD